MVIDREIPDPRNPENPAQAEIVFVNFPFIMMETKHNRCERFEHFITSSIVDG